MIHKNLDETSAFGRLARMTPFDVTQVDASRLKSHIVDVASGLRFAWGAAAIDDTHIEVLTDLAAEQQLIEKYHAVVGGEIMNPGEQRLVCHHLLRGAMSTQPITHDGRDLGAFYTEQRRRFGEFADAVRSGKETGSTGKTYTTVVQIGIGGSDLGPRALYLALQRWAEARGAKPVLRARFVSNVDPDDPAGQLADVDFERTLFVLVSKSGTTQETLTNEKFVRELAREHAPAVDVAKQTVAVTSQTSPMATGGGYRDAFFIDDFIGGRYSATSAVGGVVLSLCFGTDTFERVLSGAHAADVAATTPQIESNASMLDAMIGVYYRNVLDYRSTAVLPYSQALSRFPAHLQQLDMESNGKRVNRDGAPLAYETGPVIFGEPGTNGQHSFYQSLHQGTTVVPLQFIGFHHSQRNTDYKYDGSNSQTKLNANLAAQIVAFARGKAAENPNKHFPGGRPSSLLFAPQLTPEVLGALLAHFENKVMFQGFAWNINSFDQEGVQLGKILTTDLLGGKGGPELNAAAEVLGLSL